MPRTVLIAGAQTPLVVSLAARYLTDTGESVVVAALQGAGPGAPSYRARILDEVAQATTEAAAAPRAARLRLMTLPGGWTSPGWRDDGQQPHVDTVWCVAAGYAGVDPGLCLRMDTAAARSLLAAARALRARQFCYVGPGRLDAPDVAAVASTMGAAYLSLEREIAAHCQAAGLGHLIITASPVLGPAVGPGELVTGLPHLLDSVGWLKDYVTARDQDYFAVHPVRVAVAPGGFLDVVTAADAAGSLLRLARSGESPGRRLELPADTVGTAVALAAVAAAHGIRLIATDDGASLNPVDRLLADRLGGLTALLTVPGPASGNGDSALLALSDAARMAVARGRAVAHKARAAQAADDEATWSAGPVPFDSGPPDAATLVVVNALGQGVGYWRPLLAMLARRHRVILFQPGGDDHDGRPATGADHEAAIAQMLANRQVRRCHMLGWCTGAKTVLRYHLGHPDQVQSLVLLSPAFKSPARPEELDTEYERQLQSMARLLADRPSLAPRMLRLFSGMFDEDLGSPHADGADGPAIVLARADPRLETERRRPFATAPALMSYARQLLDFWADDVLADARRVRVPVTLVTAEHDEVVSGAGILAAVPCFPAATHEVITGATHYCMHDRPEAVAAIAEGMIAAASERA
jgi:pimeloyl-ACP methyl ester carboxylesterase